MLVMTVGEKCKWQSKDDDSYMQYVPENINWTGALNGNVHMLLWQLLQWYTVTLNVLTTVILILIFTPTLPLNLEELLS